MCVKIQKTLDVLEPVRLQVNFPAIKPVVRNVKRKNHIQKLSDSAYCGKEVGDYELAFLVAVWEDRCMIIGI